MSFKLFNDQNTAYPDLGKAFLDCGAFSVLTGQWGKLPLLDYIDFVAQYYNSFEIIAAPDFIGSATITLEYLEVFAHALIKRGVWEEVKDKVLITYHLGDRDFITLEKLLLLAAELGISWLAIGGIVTPGTSSSQRYVGINAVYTAVHTLGYSFKIHLFGGYEPIFTRVFKPSSVDSSTYLQKARMMQTFRYLPNTWKTHSLKCPRNSTDAILDFCLQHFEPLYAITGELDKSELRSELKQLPDGVKFWVINGLYMRLFEKEVRETHIPDYKYWMTVASLDDGMRYGEYVSNFLFSKMWKNASLVAYPSFHGKSDIAVTEKLKLLR